MPPRIAPDLESRIVSLGRAGHRPVEAWRAIACVVDLSTVYSAYERAGLETSRAKYGPADRKRIVSLFSENRSVKAVRQHFPGISKSTVRRIADKEGLLARGRGGAAPVSPEACGRIKASYAAGMTAQAIAHREGINKTSVLNILERAGRPRRPATVANRPYTLNDRYFDRIDTPEKAYWLGFLAADGCVTAPSVISMTLVVEDAPHLQRLANALGPGMKVLPRGRDGRYQGLAFSSPTMAADLARHGIVPRKSKILEPWHGPSRLTRHYWRGLLDGDGSINCASTGAWGLSLGGTFAVVSSFQAFAAGICGTKAKVHRVPLLENFWTFGLRGNGPTLTTLVSHLYQDGDLALPRKAEAAKRILAGRHLEAPRARRTCGTNDRELTPGASRAADCDHAAPCVAAGHVRHSSRITSK